MLASRWWMKWVWTLVLTTSWHYSASMRSENMEARLVGGLTHWSLNLIADIFICIILNYNYRIFSRPGNAPQSDVYALFMQGSSHEQLGIKKTWSIIDVISCLRTILASVFQIKSYISWCGGLPAPENSDNALRYKFRCVLLLAISMDQCKKCQFMSLWPSLPFTNVFSCFLMSLTHWGSNKMLQRRFQMNFLAWEFLSLNLNFSKGCS